MVKNGKQLPAEAARAHYTCKALEFVRGLIHAVNWDLLLGEGHRQEKPVQF